MTPIKRKTIKIIIRFFIAIMICIAIVFGLRTLLQVWKEGRVTQYPKKTISVVIDLGQREKFFERLKLFADSHVFDIHIGPTTPAGDKFNINMSNEDVIIIANNVLDPGTFDIAFYDKDPANPASEEDIDGLLNDLKRLINEVPNIKIIDGT